MRGQTTCCAATAAEAAGALAAFFLGFLTAVFFVATFTGAFTVAFAAAKKVAAKKTTASSVPGPIRSSALRCQRLSTGMRSGEIASLRWLNIALDSSLITVGKAKTKKGTGRQIPVNADMLKVLEDHARWYTRKIGEIKPEWYVFPGRAGRPVKGKQRSLDPTKPVGDITSAWDALRETCGVHCRFHDLRHTAATKLAESGASESTMLAIMGHMSRAMLERYSHIRMAAKREAVKSLELPKVGPRLVSSRPMSKGRQSQGKVESPKAVNV